MAIAKKGSRKICVDQIEYRWKIRRNPTYCQEMGWGNLLIAVEQVEDGHCTLIIDSGVVSDKIYKPIKRKDSPDDFRSITPKMVEGYIRKALEKGWIPKQKGSAFQLIAEN